MLHLTMEGTVLTLLLLAIILSISSFRIILLYYSCCREHERNQYRGDGGFAVKYDNTNSRGSIALEEINKDECQLDNLSDHNYEEIPSARVSFEDIYIDDTIEDQKNTWTTYLILFKCQRGFIIHSKISISKRKILHANAKQHARVTTYTIKQLETIIKYR